MRSIRIYPLLLFLASAVLFGAYTPGKEEKMRQPVDTVGFATKAFQMDSVMQRILRIFGNEISSSGKNAGTTSKTAWKAAICPHDDYTYASWLYPALLQHIKAKTVILFGVAHKAKQFKIEDKLVFDNFDSWKEPYGPVKISWLREEIISALPHDIFIIHDSLQRAEHSVEAIVPFLQYYNRNVEIISILVPYTSYERMEKLSTPLAEVLNRVLKNHKLEWGKDVAIVISTDAVHYGDKDWGGQNYAQYGCGEDGFVQAKAHEKEIIDHCLTGVLSYQRIRSFVGYTVKEEDYRSYKWTWCGRYSVPFGLLTALKMQEATSAKPLRGSFIGYSTSISHTPLPVSDIGMGKTAIAEMHHWVGYCSVGYK